MSTKLIKQIDNVAIYEMIQSGNQAQIESFLSLYAQLFPQYAHYTPRMRRRTALPQNYRSGHMLHYWMVEVDGECAGLRSFRYIEKRRCGLAIALAIAPQFRTVKVNQQRLSVFIIYACLQQIIEDSLTISKQAALGMVNEVESPHLMDHYEQNGLIRLPIDYMEPIFPAEQAGRSRQEEIDQVIFAPMQLGFLKNPTLDIDLTQPNLLKDFALAFLVDHYNLPEDHPIVQQILASIHPLSGA